ncbi:MAG: Lrp/AsnC family transcriptional regulator [Hyphomicrobiales bacterium]
MDDLDHRLISLLRRNARLPVASLAAATGVSRATVRARLDRLEGNGTIEGFTVVLGSQLRSQSVRTIIMIEVQGRAGDAVIKALLGLPQVRAVHSTNGRWDLIAQMESPDLASFDQTLRKIRLIDGISLTESNILLTSRGVGVTRLK